MYKVTYSATDGREITALVNSWTEAMNKATKLAIWTKRPPFPIVITNDYGEIVHKIKG